MLLVRQALGLRLWTLPGGKLKRGESLVKALKRELYEKIGLHAQIGSLLGVMDRRDKESRFSNRRKFPLHLRRTYSAAHKASARSETRG